MTDPHSPSVVDNDTSKTPPLELEGVAVRVGGKMVAWFSDAEEAEEWCRDTHFGNWLMHECSIPDRPAFTSEQLAEARRLGAELHELLKPGRLAE